MFRDLGEKLLHPATIISAVALIVALSGSAYAISQLPKNSVGTKQIRNGAVTSPKVKDASLLARDFRAGQLPAGPRGEQGPRGETGATGATGPAGPTFSFAVQNPSGTPVPVATSGTEVVNRTISIPRAGRLIVNFTGRFRIASSPIPSVGDAAQAACSASTLPGPTQASSVQVSSQATYRASFQSSDAQISLTFGYDVPAAGEYTFLIQCVNSQLVGTPGLDFNNYDMTGVLTSP
ncbi:MAG: hypothetical protein ACKOL0_02370 [Solirubrobacterales bacterium]